MCKFEKQSNRALALHIQTKLYSIGLQLVEGGRVTLYEERIRDQEVLEYLAKGEHLRWNAFSFVNGWRTMTDIENHDRNKDAIAKTHSCPVDWDELDKVRARFGRDYKEMDRHLIRNIGNVLKAAGYGVEAILRDITQSKSLL